MSEAVLAKGDLLGAAGAIGPIAGPIIALALGLWANSKRFRPKFRAEIDQRRQGIRLWVSNNGRRGGRVSEVAVVVENVQVPTNFSCLDQGRFHSAEIKHKEEWRLNIEAVEERFPDEARVLVRWGRRRQKQIEPTLVKTVSIFGETSNWPTSA